MKNRTELAKYFAELGFDLGAEIGVAQGYYSITLCKQNPKLKLYCVDYWGPYEGYVDFFKHEKIARYMYGEAKRNLADFNCELIQKMSVEASKDFKDGSLDFVFIDASHLYKHVKEDISAWVPKVRKGGIVAGHDYYVTKTGNRGVINAVDEYVKENGYELKLTDWDKENPSKDDRQPCWYFVK